MIDEQLAGYRIEGVLGRGGMGVVYRAVDARLGRMVALKVMAPEQADDADFRRRFLQESRAAAAIDHPNVLPVYEAGEDGDVLFLATRLVEGSDLKELLALDGALRPSRAVALLGQLAGALDAAHARGLVHRDVKPANVLVPAARGPGGAPHAYLTDFGLAKHTEASTALTATGQFVGTLDYIAPEQLQGGDIDGRADQYALAALLFECLTGAPPFKRHAGGPAIMWAHLNEPAPSVSEHAPDVPARLDEVIARAMAKAPDDRFPTCTDFHDAAAAALGDGRRAPNGSLADAPTRPRAKDADALADAATRGRPGDARPSPSRPGATSGSRADAVVAPAAGRRPRGIAARRALLIVLALAAVAAAGVAAWLAFGDGGGEPAVTRLTPADARWTARTAGRIVSTPAVDDDVLVVGSDDRAVHAFDATDGDVRWRTDTEGTVRSSPAVRGDDVYVGSFDGNLYGLGIRDGEERWATPTGFEVFSSPAVTGDMVVVGAQGVVAVDAGSGAVRWRADTGGPVNSSPAAEEGTVYVGADDGVLYALDAGSGEERWSERLGGEVYSSPAVADGLVYVGSRTGLHALDAETGRPRWRLDTSEGVNSSPAVARGMVYVGTRDRHVYALDARTGERRWRFEAGDRVDSSPVVAGGLVYVGANDGVVHGLDARSGEERWRFEAGDPVVAAPVVAEGLVYVATTGGALYAIEEGT